MTCAACGKDIDLPWIKGTCRDNTGKDSPYYACRECLAATEYLPDRIADLHKRCRDEVSGRKQP